jgi:hypothetical protein
MLLDEPLERALHAPVGTRFVLDRAARVRRVIGGVKLGRIVVAWDANPGPVMFAAEVPDDLAVPADLFVQVANCSAPI